jgi:hypothetical protein
LKYHLVLLQLNQSERKIHLLITLHIHCDTHTFLSSRQGCNKIIWQVCMIIWYFPVFQSESHLATHKYHDSMLAIRKTESLHADGYPWQRNLTSIRWGGWQDFKPPIHLTDSDFAVITQVPPICNEHLARRSGQVYQRFLVDERASLYK